MIVVVLLGAGCLGALIYGLYQFMYHQKQRTRWIIALVFALVLFVAALEMYMQFDLGSGSIY